MWWRVTYINCTKGVKQGDVCSLVLFTLFINELPLENINNGRHSVSFNSYFVELFILLFADIILLFESVVGLQNQLNNICHAACNPKLKENMNNSNMMVLRKGGNQASCEGWFYDSKEIFGLRIRRSLPTEPPRHPFAVDWA